MNVQPIRLMWW